MSRFEKCPKCFSKDIEIHDLFGALIEGDEGAAWGCWDCDWVEPLNKEEIDDRTARS